MMKEEEEKGGEMKIWVFVGLLVGFRLLRMGVRGRRGRGGRRGHMQNRLGFPFLWFCFKGLLC